VKYAIYCDMILLGDVSTMTLDTSKCNHMTPLHFKGLNSSLMRQW